MKQINIFILAAGLGERLRPITYQIPKPLLPVLGKPVIQHVLDKVSKLPFDKIAINLHHKHKDIEEWLKGQRLHQHIAAFYENKILGTGGALKNAEDFLKEKPFLVHNSDVLTDMNLQKLIDYHVSSGNLVTLAVHDYAEFNCLMIDEMGYLKGISKALQQPANIQRLLAFTGVAVYQPEFLKFLPHGASSVVDVWKGALSTGQKLGTYDVSGSRWRDIGTSSSYASAVFEALREEGEMVYVHPSVTGCRDIELKGYVAVEGNIISSDNVSLENCILLPGSSIEEGVHYENYIIGPGFRTDLDTKKISLLFKSDGRQLIGTGGSDRIYYRVKEKEKSVVLMQSRIDDPDFERQIRYARFFKKHSVPVPELIEVKKESMQAVFEDAGDISLYSYLKFPRKTGRIECIYKKVIDALVKIHTISEEDVTGLTLLRERVFDYDHFRWETDYFIKSFVEGINKIKVGDRLKLEKEFNELAVKADSFPKTVVHRDFQSQNIMVINGQELRIIDYQGARVGPPAYDLASLLWDPYFRISDDIRENLLDYYIDRIKRSGIRDFDEQDFRSSLIYCRLQRHMQALGAYGFLSFVKGKKYFLKFVPEGLRLLKEDILPVKSEYPELYKLIMKLNDQI